jgi:hypothetical protein
LAFRATLARAATGFALGLAAAFALAWAFLPATAFAFDFFDFVISPFPSVFQHQKSCGLYPCSTAATP